MSERERGKKCANGKSRCSEFERQGSVRQFVVDEPRLNESVELHKFLGYEVKLEPVVFDEAEGSAEPYLSESVEFAFHAQVNPSRFQKNIQGT